MKIGLVCPYNMFQRPGGVPHLIIHLAEGLRKRGHSVKIITPRPTTYKGKVPEDYILLGSVRNFGGGFGTAGAWGSTFNVAEVKRTLEEEKFDIINFHEPWIPMIGWQILNYSKAAHVGTFHANLADNTAGKFWINTFYPIGKPMIEKLDILTAPSKVPTVMLMAKANEGNQLHQFLMDNFTIIPNGVDLRKYRPPKSRQPLSGKNTKTIVYVGRLEKRKGVEYLLEAFNLLVKEMPNVHLVIAGKGGKQKELEYIVEDNKTPNVSFSGFITDEEKIRLFGNADLVCAPAMYGESFGIVLVEAMAMGAPIIAGANLGFKSVMSGKGRIGLVDAQSADDFANRMAVFLSVPEIEKMMRNWGIATSKQYEYERVIKQYEATYKQAIKISNQRKIDRAEKKNDGRLKKIGRRLFVRRHA
ncbi:glycosyltransferase family 4 protein [Candidatus Saccharibacteria bacterium]|nr:glycosyltransferase family 4 protein [Candidatus Saccharibacteria bacterium]